MYRCLSIGPVSVWQGVSLGVFLCACVLGVWVSVCVSLGEGLPESLGVCVCVRVSVCGPVCRWVCEAVIRLTYLAGDSLSTDPRPLPSNKDFHQYYPP